MSDPKIIPASTTGNAQRCLSLDRINQAQEAGERVRLALVLSQYIAQSRAVLEAIEGRASHDEAFRETLGQAHDYWGSTDPEGLVLDALGDLLDNARTDLHRLMQAIEPEQNTSGGQA